MSAYATAEELAAYTGTTAPADAERLLLRASELVDYVTRGRIDTTDTDHTDAARTAVCAICEAWAHTGEPTGALSGNVQSYTAGKVSVTYAQGSGSGGGGSALPVRAYQALLSAGLLSAGVAVV